MTVYFGNDRKCVPPSMTATCATVRGLTARTGNVAHKLYLENKTINCSTVTPNQTEIRGNFGKTVKLKCCVKD